MFLQPSNRADRRTARCVASATMHAQGHTENQTGTLFALSCTYTQTELIDMNNVYTLPALVIANAACVS